MEIHWIKAGVQGGDGSSLAELQGWSISCRRRSVHLSLLGPGIDDSSCAAHSSHSECNPQFLI